ncbi:DUF6193 family natural product biosynthesis protein [Amycolatopsis sp. NPDC004079]|uniref:DUF6193 family natural product biosynthesis protein n=1 Tax=Amycolatopsis sp. NPDC004079 TaxID=3154549 RepID=UPI0033A5D578
MGTEFTWKQYLAPQQAAHLTASHSFLAAALRALNPFTSHDNLSFRPAVRYAELVGLLTEPPGDDRYRAYGPGQKETGAAGSVELALDAIAPEWLPEAPRPRPGRSFPRELFRHSYGTRDIPYESRLGAERAENPSTGKADTN